MKMIKNKLLEVKEYDIIYKDKSDNSKDFYIDENKRIFLKPTLFDELQKAARSFSEKQKKSGKLGFLTDKTDSIKLTNYVGAIKLKDGFQIQILPKISFENTKAANILLEHMLYTLKGIGGSSFSEDVSISPGNFNLCETFISMYVAEAKLLAKRGLKSNYVRQEDNLKVFKGKLLIPQHIRLNFAHKERFYVEFDEFSLNTPENRIIKSTLEKLRKCSVDAKNSKDIKQLLMYFDTVDLSYNYKNEFSKITINRNNKGYEQLLGWSEIILGNESFSPVSGDVSAWSLLYPIYDLYEKYVAKYVEQIFPKDGWTVKKQDKVYLFNYLVNEKKDLFQKRPDIVLKKRNSYVVLDTKWIKLNPNKDAYIPYGIEKDDLIQIYLYGCRYNAKEVWLLYPDTGINEQIEFSNRDNDLVIKVFFVKLFKDRKPCIEESIEALKNKINA